MASPHSHRFLLHFPNHIQILASGFALGNPKLKGDNSKDRDKITERRKTSLKSSFEPRIKQCLRQYVAFFFLLKQIWIIFCQLQHWVLIEMSKILQKPLNDTYTATAGPSQRGPSPCFSLFSPHPSPSRHTGQPGLLAVCWTPPCPLVHSSHLGNWHILLTHPSLCFCLTECHPSCWACSRTFFVPCWQTRVFFIFWWDIVSSSWHIPCPSCVHNRRKMYETCQLS